ncbi:MAG: type III pantothenate kinase, partial [Lachnospiraceae bacterium]|nr:type III pantothenate kinase [Lachnospiraceae bacterium]
MILVVDVGNTNLTWGVYDKKELKATFRMTTKTPRTSDEYGVLLTEMLRNRGIDPMHLEGSIVASVVPDIMHALLGAISRYTNTKPLNVGPGIKTGINVATANPREVGADRIVDALAAYEIYGGPVIVVNYGTATRY